MWIGDDTDECRYKGQADILLTGEKKTTFALLLLNLGMLKDIS